MPRLAVLASLLAALLLAGCAAHPADSGFSLRATGDARLYGVSFTKPYPTGSR